MGCRFIREADTLEAAPAFRKLAEGTERRHCIGYRHPRYMVIKAVTEKRRANATEVPHREVISTWEGNRSVSSSRR